MRYEFMSGSPKVAAAAGGAFTGPVRIRLSPGRGRVLRLTRLIIGLSGVAAPAKDRMALSNNLDNVRLVLTVVAARIGNHILG